MNEEQVKKIVQQEMANNHTSGSPQVPPHQHNGVDNLKVNQANIIPGNRVSGSITFSHIGDYTLYCSGSLNPTLILCYGTVVDSVSTPTIRCHTMGSAQIGRSYYFQPLSTDSVSIGNSPVQPFIQSSSYMMTSLGGHTITYAGTSIGSSGSTFLTPPVLTPGQAQALTSVSLNTSAITVYTPVFHALTDEGHLVDVEYSGIHARMTLTGYTQNSITLHVDNLDSGWAIIVNLVVI